MEFNTIIGILALGVALVSALGLVYYFVAPKESNSNIQSLMGRKSDYGLGKPSDIKKKIQEDETGEEYEKLKSATRRGAKKKKVKLTLDEKFFQAGMVSPDSKREFYRMRILFPCFAAPIGAFLGAKAGVELGLLGGVFGLLMGFQLPFSILDRRIKNRHEDIMYYLPLVIEQIAIGVSSSLDIGPCLARVVQMADERDTHNAVTELVRHAQFHVKSGVSMEQALTEIGKQSGQNELKHAFMSLSQVAKHGGEITRQLQELADAVASQRETKIEAKIKKLELEATGPVALVFLGFMVILLIGFGLQITGAL